MKSRIWELDALRGLCILGVIAVHLVYDVTVLYRLVVWTPPALFQFIQRWGGVLFLLISGICVTLGSRCVKRGLVVFSCGMLISAVHTEKGEEKLNLLMVSDAIPAGAKLC